MTKRNKNGNRKYLNVDTDTHCFDLRDRWYMPTEEYMEITEKVYKQLYQNCLQCGFRML